MKSRPLPAPTAPQGGFTLVELLVACAVGMLLLVLLSNAFHQVLSSYSLVQGSVIRQGDAALALDQTIQDLEGLVIPNLTAAEALRATPETVKTSATQWLTFLSTATDPDDSTVPFDGATRAVSYRMAYQNPIDLGATDAVFALYRSVAPAQVTFDAVVNTAKSNHQEAYWKNVPAGTGNKPQPPLSTDSFLAANVVRFQVRFQRADDNQWTDVQDAVRIASDGSTVNNVVVPGGFRRAEVSLTVLSPAGAERAKTNANLDELIQRYGKTFVRQTAFAF